MNVYSVSQSQLFEMIHINLSALMK